MEEVSFLPSCGIRGVRARTFGGITRLPGTAAGQWREGSKTYVDTLVIYVMALSSIAQGHLVGEVAAFAKVHYAQEAIYVSYLGLNEIL